MPRVAAVAATRSVYAPSRRTSPFALLASAGLVGGLISAFLLSHVVLDRKVERRPLIVNLMTLPATPPETEQKQPEPPKSEPVPQSSAPVPLPQVTVPTPAAPVLVTPPPAPVPVAAAPAPPGPPAPAASGPREAGDLTGNLVAADPPSYPVESRRMREQGTVVLSVLVSIAGTVEDISVARSSGYVRLDRAALKAVRHWRWSPFRQHGEEVQVRGQVTIPFILKA